MVILDAASAKVFRDSIHGLQQDIHLHLHRDQFCCWEVDRPHGWQDSTSIEGQRITCYGWGKLYPNGVGGPAGGDMVIHVESPYRFRAQAVDPIETGNLLVLNGSRLFRVDTTKVGEGESVLMDVYLTELFLTPMPGML